MIKIGFRKTALCLILAFWGLMILFWLVLPYLLEHWNDIRIMLSFRAFEWLGLVIKN